MTADEIRSAVRASLHAWVTRVDDVDYSILKGEHEDRLVDEIVRRLDDPS